MFLSKELTTSSEILFSEAMACTDCGINIPTLEPRSFSFNSRFGACLHCRGTGSELQADMQQIIENPEAPLSKLKLTLPDKEFEHSKMLPSSELCGSMALGRMFYNLILKNGRFGPYLQFEIEAEENGIIHKILVENGHAVEFNQPLFLINPK